MLVERVEPLVQLRIVLDEPEIDRVHGLRDAGMHQRPQVERVHRHGVVERGFDRLGRAHVSEPEP